MDLLLSPLAWLAAAGLLAGVAGWLPYPGVLRVIALLVGLGSLAAMTPWVANRLLGQLERDAPRAACASAPEVLVVLAGGVDLRPRDAADFGALNGASRRRMDAAITAWRAAPGTRLGRVTSASHWPRARLAFDASGLRPCAVVADVRRLPAGLPWALIPRLGALEKTEDALHEIVGLAWYRWRARDDA